MTGETVGRRHARGAPRDKGLPMDGQDQRHRADGSRGEVWRTLLLVVGVVALVVAASYLFVNHF